MREAAGKCRYGNRYSLSKFGKKFAQHRVFISIGVQKTCFQLARFLCHPEQLIDSQVRVALLVRHKALPNY